MQYKRSMLEGIAGPVGSQIGIGGLGGIIVGYALKKIAKILALLLGLMFVGLQYLAYRGIIGINYDRLNELTEGVVLDIGIDYGTSFILTNIPFTGSFAAGIALGFSKG